MIREVHHRVREDVHFLTLRAHGKALKIDRGFIRDFPAMVVVQAIKRDNGVNNAIGENDCEMVTIAAHRALVAEDEGMTVMLLRRALTVAGFEVVGAAANGEQAVRLADELKPDFILMDVNMP